MLFCLSMHQFGYTRLSLILSLLSLAGTFNLIRCKQKYLDATIFGKNTTHHEHRNGDLDDRDQTDRHSTAKTTLRAILILTRSTRLLSQQVQSDSISKMPSPVKKPLLDSGAVLRFAKLSEHAMAPSKGEVHLRIRTVVISSWTTKMLQSPTLSKL